MTPMPIYHTITLEFDEEVIKRMLKDYNVPVTDENIDDVIERIRDDITSDEELTLENCVQYLADDLGVVPPDA